MDKIRLELLDKQRIVYIPVMAENDVTEISIDMSDAKVVYPMGQGEIWWRRPDGEFYLLESTEEDGVLTATLTDVETEVSGIANAEAWWIDGSHLKKSPTYKLGIHQSFTAPDQIRELIEEQETTLDRCVALEALMEETRDNTYEARDMALAARDEAMESAERAAAYDENAGHLLDTTVDYVDEMVAHVDASVDAAALSETNALNSANLAQTERIAAQTAAANAATDRAAIEDTLDGAAASASAAAQYARMAQLEHNGADTAYNAALEQQDLAQEARRDAQTAQVAAEAARDAAINAMNRAGENEKDTEDLYAAFLERIASIEERLTALENKG